MQDTALRIGLIGLGTVGSQVADRLLNWREQLRRRSSGVDLVLERVLVRDLEKKRAVQVPAGLLTADPSAVLDDPRIDVVVELAGGEEPARSFIERALRNRKHVVTANKMVLASHGPELLELAGEMNVDVYFEAAVGGGIPLISTFKVDLLANEIERVIAVINGTTNYVLGRMANGGLELPAAVAEAQAAGYAEADPTQDLGGYDAAYKLAILASIAFGARVHPDVVYREGIESVHAVDFRYARELGYELKLVASAAREPSSGRIEARVHPALVPHGHPLAAVEGAANAVYIEGDLVGQVLLQGQGAGGRPTASSVVGDLIELARSIRRQVQNRAAFQFDPAVRVVPMAEVMTRAYLRCRVGDRPGVLAAIFQVFGEEGVSIASAIQKESDDVSAEFVVTTHPAPDAALQRTRARIAELEVVVAVNSFLRVL
ncbi:MAG: homoserine dehydrogenase [Candidatus Dormibacteraeota bacterium]|nr:homoserine dehydrogenase [Candidatus Dormibacteraeota bacterium]